MKVFHGGCFGAWVAPGDSLGRGAGYPASLPRLELTVNRLAVSGEGTNLTKYLKLF